MRLILLSLVPALLLLSSGSAAADDRLRIDVFDSLDRAVTFAFSVIDNVAEPSPADDSQFGLFVAVRDRTMRSIDQLPLNTRRAVVLVHGLDEPGWIWDELVPCLVDAGYDVLRFEYPNDQAIADSADLLADQLRGLRARGVERISIVGHSMGGLVTRDALTRPEYYNGDGEGGSTYPAVDHLIMLGTPNHGAALAKVRFVAEVRETVVRWFRNGTRSDWDADGRGEAGRDLVPGSGFLAELNARPLATHTHHTLIAGRITHVGADRFNRMERGVRRAAQNSALPDEFVGWLADEIATPTIDLLREANDGMGDGVVAMDSVRLDGIDDFVVVNASHLGMIANYVESDREPPAIQIVLERLEAIEEARPGDSESEREPER